MAMKQGGGLGLFYDWVLGTFWKTEMDANLKKLDAIVQLVVLSRSETAPPAAAHGDRYIVAAGSTGAWSGQDGNIAVYNSYTPGWEFIKPEPYWYAYVVDINTDYRYRQSDGWTPDNNGNVIYVREGSDFGPISGGYYVTDADKTYILVNDLNISTPIRIPDGSSFTLKTEEVTLTLTYTGTDPLFNLNNGSFVLEDMTVLSGSGGDIFNISGATSFISNGVLLAGTGSIGTINSPTIKFFQSFFALFSSTGFLQDGSSEISFSHCTVLGGGLGVSSNVFDLYNGSIDVLRVSDCNFKTNGSGPFLRVASEDATTILINNNVSLDIEDVINPVDSATPNAYFSGNTF